MKKKIAVIVGSLRKESFNRKIALNLMQLAPETLDMKIIEIGDLSLYNQDDESHPKEEWVKFREEIKKYDGVLFVTPEYNRSIPAALKNAIDVGSRPYGQGVWNGKPGAIVSASPSAMGGFGSSQHLRQSLASINVPCLSQPEVYLSQVDKLLDEKGQIKESSTREFLSKFMQAYANWVITLTECK